MRDFKPFPRFPLVFREDGQATYIKIKYINGKKYLVTFDVKNMVKPKLGFFELCFDVSDINASIEFYKKLGFTLLKGASEYGTACMTNGDIRLTLFAENTIIQEFGVHFLLNFRGGM